MPRPSKSTAAIDGVQLLNDAILKLKADAKALVGLVERFQHGTEGIVVDREWYDNALGGLAETIESDVVSLSIACGCDDAGGDR